MSRNTRKNIMETAKDLFSEKGYAAVTTKEIAKAAGVNEVTLFRHFENKRNLFKSILHEQLHQNDLLDYLKNKATYDVRKDLTLVANEIKKTYIENALLIKMMMKDVMHDSDEHKEAKHKEDHMKEALGEYFVKLSEKGLIYDDPKRLVMLFSGNIYGFCMGNYVFHKRDDDGEFDWMVSKIIDVILMKSKEQE
jgi:AcrR family transcriptional regulator